MDQRAVVNQHAHSPQLQRAKLIVHRITIKLMMLLFQSLGNQTNNCIQCNLMQITCTITVKSTPV